MEFSDFIHMALELGVVLFLVLLNGFFVAAEFAIVKIRDTQLETLIESGNRRAKVARALLKDLDASLSATQLGITLASLGLGWYAEPVFESMLEPVFAALGVEAEGVRHAAAVVVGFSVITFLHIVAGELAPKSMAIQKPLPVTLWISLPLRWFYKISYPINWALNNTALWLLRLVGIEPASESEHSHSPEELRLLIQGSHHGLGATPLGRNIILNALDLRHRVARDVLKPRREIIALNTEDTIQKCLKTAEVEGYSRYPLCENGDLDRTLGVVHFKDLFAHRNGVETAGDLKPVCRKLIYVPENTKLEKLLSRFMDRRLHMAIIVDEYGGSVGMVTLEDILEELVGQIQDEFDQEAPLIQKVGKDTLFVDGALALHEFSEATGGDFQEGDLTTVSGWVTQRLGKFPQRGDVLEHDGFRLKVESVEGSRVSRLKVTRQPVVTEGQE